MAAKSSKIPGYEQLTRPEEISALSKYLKAKKQDLEDSLYLQQDNLEVPGRHTGKVPTIKSLPDSYENLKVSGISLPENKHGEPEGLYDSVLMVEENKHGQPEALYDTVLGMEENKNKEPNELEGKREELSDTRDQELSVQREKLEVSENIALSDHREDLEKERAKDIELQNEKVNLSGPKEKEINLEDQGKNISKVRGGEKETPSLGNEKEKLNVDIENNLDSTKVDLISSTTESPEELENERVERGGEEKSTPLETQKEKLHDDRKTALENQISKIIDERQITLETEKEGLFPNTHNEVISLEEFKSKFLDALGENAEKLTDEELFSRAINLINTRGDFGYAEGENWEDKIAALLSTYLSGEGRISPLQAKEFEVQLEKTLDTLRVASGVESIPKLSEWNKAINSLGLSRILGRNEDVTRIPGTQIGQHTSHPDAWNTNKYIRWAAEQTVSLLDGAVGGNTKRILIEEAIAGLVIGRAAIEKATKTRRDRLPGDIDPNLTAFFQGGLTGLGKSLVNSGKQALKDLWSPNGHKAPFNRPDPEDGNPQESKRKVYGPNGEIDFSEKYGQGIGLKTTLKDLCSYEGEVTSLNSVVDQLRKDNNFISTWEKGKNLTLDTNSYWEIILEPYCGDLNGGWSYLPSIDEINTLNNRLHGVTTAYNGWIPFTSFELSKSKVNTKSVGLYDGEIVFPVSMEFTNELRLSIIDDQYKSWRNYFQKCSDVAIYNSEPHTKGYYVRPGLDYGTTTITAVDKTNICPAFYQNLAFRIRIYVMTPQYSTIRKFDLLCVLKDFMEEFSGDIDAGAGDLSIAFSIVGENPPLSASTAVGNLTATGAALVNSSEPTAANPNSGGGVIKV